jgi:hypothetical protein
MLSNQKNLQYEFCDDWLIFFKDKETGKRYYVITEMWLEWAELPENAISEENAIEKYMLPVALKKIRRNQLFGLYEC